MASRSAFGIRCAFPPETKATRTRAVTKKIVSTPAFLQQGNRRAPHVFWNRDNLKQVIQDCRL